MVGKASGYRVNCLRPTDGSPRVDRRSLRSPQDGAVRRRGESSRQLRFLVWFTWNFVRGSQPVLGPQRCPTCCQAGEGWMLVRFIDRTGFAGQCRNPHALTEPQVKSPQMPHRKASARGCEQNNLRTLEIIVVLRTCFLAHSTCLLNGALNQVCRRRFK